MASLPDGITLDIPDLRVTITPRSDYIVKIQPVDEYHVVTFDTPTITRATSIFVDYAQSASYANGAGSAVSASYATTASYVSGVASTWDDISGKPDGLVSSSTQITITESQISDLTPHYTDSDTLDYINTVGVFSSSAQVDYDSIQNVPSGLVSSSTQVDYDSIQNVPSGLVSSSSQINTGSFNGSFEGTFVGDGSGLTGVTAIGTGVDIRDDGSILGAAQILDFVDGIDVIVTDSTASISLNRTGSFSGSFSGDGSGLTNIVSASFATTASYVEGSASDWDTLANKPAGLVSSSTQILLDQVSGVTFSANDFYFPQNLVVEGTLTAQEFYIEYVSSSVIYESGSTKFGDSADDTHQFTGSLSVDGTISATTINGVFSSSAQVDYDSIQNIPSGLVSSSVQINTGSFTGSFNGSFSNIISSGSSPTPSENYLWYDDTTGKTYIYYVSASVGQWVLQSDPTYEPAPTLQDLQDITDLGNTTTNKIIITNTTSATSISTGALIVSGGLGISGSVHAISFVGDGSQIQNVTATGVTANSVTLATDTTGNFVNSITAGTGISSTGATSGENISHTLSIDLTEITVGSGLTVADATTLNLDISEVIATDGVNRILTSDADGTLTAEPNFIFDGSELGITGNIDASGNITASAFNGDGTQITGIISSSYAVTASYAENAGSNDWNDITNIPSGLVSSSVQINTGSFSGSFNGSFVGDGSGLTGVVAEGDTGIQVRDDGSPTGTALILNFADGLDVTGTTTASISLNRTGSFTGSFYGDGSQVTGVVSSSYTLTSSYSNTSEWSGLNNIPSGLVSSSTQVDYDSIQNVPSGIVSSSVEGDAQGQIKLNGVNVDVNSMQTTDTVTFASITSSNDSLINSLTVGRGGGNISTNTAVGYQSLQNNTTGNLNTAVGYRALVSNTLADSNLAIGANALENFDSATNYDSYNVAIGRAAMQNSSGSSTQFNVAVGGIALLNNRAARNVAIGYSALRDSTTGGYNTAVGYGALTTWNGVGDGNNVAIGTNAMSSASGSSTSNVAVGVQSLSTTVGGQNTAVGNTSLLYNTAGIGNSAFGYYSMRNSANGNYNTAVGHQAVRFTSDGHYNVGVGAQALYSNRSGSNNIAVGYQALYDLEDLTTHSNNTVLGYNSGRGIVTGSSNTILGANVTGLPTELSNTIIIADGQGNYGLYISSSQNAQFYGDVVTSGDVTASGFYGDGSQVTGVVSSSYAVTASYVDGATITGVVSASYAETSSYSNTSEWSGLNNIPSGLVSSSTQITITESQISDLTHYTDTDTLDYINTVGVFSSSAQVDYGTIQNVPSGIVSASSFTSPSQGTVRATINGVQTDVDTGLQTGDSPQFTNLTLSGNLTVNGTTTYISSSQVDIGDQIITLNANNASGDGGIYVNDTSTNETGSLLWDVSENYWIAGLLGSESEVITLSSLNAKGVFSSSAQVNADSVTNFDSNVLTYINSLGAISSSAQVDYDSIQNVPSGIVSSSAQIDHDQTTNYSADEHFTQTNITTVGTVTSGDISAILPSGTVSSSTQITITESQISDLTHYTDTDTLDYINTVGVFSSSAQVNADSVTNFDSNVLTYINSLGAISSSSQITITESQISDLTHYTDTDTLDYINSVGVFSSSAQVDYGTIQNVPSGIVSSSTQFTTLSAPFTGSFTGSFSGDGSGLTSLTADTASYVNPLIQDVFITGGLHVSGSASGSINFYGPTQGSHPSGSYVVKIRQPGEDINLDNGPRYGLKVEQVGPRYELNIGIHSEVLNERGYFGGGDFEDFTLVRGIGVFGKTPGESHAYQKGIGLYGKSENYTWNYNSAYGVVGIATAGSSSFGNAPDYKQAAYGGYFQGRGRGNSIGVHADAYLFPDSGSGQIAIPLLVSTNGTQLMRVDWFGNVGIGTGTSTPTHKLQIVGNVSASSYTGSFYGDGSQVTGVVSASYASTGGSGLVTKAGSIANTSFTGNPRTATVTFSTAFSDTNYAVVVTGEDSRAWTIESKGTTGFTVNSNAVQALSGNTYWTATAYGETQ